MTWIRTHSGEQFNLLDADAETVKLLDIVQALSHICRFGGHTKEFYSVLQHSLLVGEIVFGAAASEEAALVGIGKLVRTALLHDASEAYVGDMVRPLKHTTDMGEQFRKIQEPIEKVISERFDLVYPLPDIVLKADDIALMTEARDLIDDDTDRWDLIRKDIAPLRARISPIAHFKEVRQQFIRAWVSFGGGDVGETDMQ